MPLIATREEFSEYCLRKLGAPVIQINVAAEQVEDRIEEALYRFYERHVNAVEEYVLIKDIADEDIDNGFLTLGHDVLTVTNVFRPYLSAGTMSIEYSAMVNEIYSTLGNNGIGSMDYYYMTRSHFSLLNKFFRPERQFSFNTHTKKLIITGGLTASADTDGFLCVRGMKKVLGDSSEALEGDTIGNIWQDRWLQNYATALIKKQWAQNLGKYQGVQLLGGVTMNGDALMLQANEEIEKLEIELEQAYEFPPQFFMG